MKKANVIFLGECLIIVALLVLIGRLISTDDRYVLGKEKKEEASQETELIEENTEGGQIQYAKDILQQERTVGYSAKTVSENLLEADSSKNDDGEITVAVFGDSIWDDKRGADGVSERLEEMLGVTVYNCSIGGTSAAVVSDPTDVREGWSSKSVNGLMYIARKEESSEFLEGLPAKEIIDAVNFEEVDYLIISYGLNDYFSGVEIYPEDMYDMTTYVGALRHTVAKMTETYPEMEVLLIAPSYTEFSTELSEGSVEDYVAAAKEVSEEYGTAFLDTYHDLGINGENKNQYLYDGVHLSAEGRALYADFVAAKLTEMEK
ncbi:MAG: SGNH/GDSL hydrolase family protein [Lachnospiraceae bacterium]